MTSLKAYINTQADGDLALAQPGPA